MSTMVWFGCGKIKIFDSALNFEQDKYTQLT